MGGEDLDEIFASSLIGSRNISIIENVKTILKGNNQPKDTYMEVVYPEGGFSALWEEMGKKIRAYRGTIFTSMQIKAIYHSNDGCLIDSDNRRYYDFMISSIAPQTLGKLMQQEVRLNFSYRNIMIVYLSLHVREKINLHCLYIYDEACKIARLTNYSFFERNFQNDILVGLEYWLGDDGMWQYSEADILNQVKKDMDCLPFFKEYEIKQWEVKKFKNAYVVPDLSMQRVADTIHGGLQRHSNLVITGRSQSKNFNYSMEDAMTDGKSAANYVITKKAVTPRQITLMPHGD